MKQLLNKKQESTGLKYCEDSEGFTEDSNVMDDIYIIQVKNIKYWYLIWLLIWTVRKKATFLHFSCSLVFSIHYI